MPRQNRGKSEKGSVLVETMIGSIIFMLFALFTIDLSQTTFTLHRINYLAKSCARETGISAGKRSRELRKKFQRVLLPAFFKELRAGRVRSIIISFLNQKGNRLPDSEPIKSGTVLTLRVEADVSMNFAPFRLFKPLAQNVKRGKISLSEGKFQYKTENTFIVE
jgi:hypothetical protein